MKFLKRIWSQLHRFIFWAVILGIFWCWIYTFVGDAPREKKVMVYVDAYALEQRDLSLRLEDEGLPEGIRMIQVRGFNYDLFGTTLEGDVYLMKESLLKATLEETPGKLTAFEAPEGFTGYEWEGENWALLVFDAASQTGPAMDQIQYARMGEREPESYYLCFDAQSPHLKSAPNAVDNAAWEVALNLLKLDP